MYTENEMFQMFVYGVELGVKLQREGVVRADHLPEFIDLMYKTKLKRIEHDPSHVSKM